MKDGMKGLFSQCDLDRINQILHKKHIEESMRIWFLRWVIADAQSARARTESPYEWDKLEQLPPRERIRYLKNIEQAFRTLAEIGKEGMASLIGSAMATCPAHKAPGTPEYELETALEVGSESIHPREQDKWNHFNVWMETKLLCEEHFTEDWLTRLADAAKQRISESPPPVSHRPVDIEMQRIARRIVHRWFDIGLRPSPSRTSHFHQVAEICMKAAGYNRSDHYRLFKHVIQSCSFVRLAPILVPPAKVKKESFCTYPRFQTTDTHI